MKNLVAGSLSIIQGGLLLANQWILDKALDPSTLYQNPSFLTAIGCFLLGIFLLLNYRPANGSPTTSAKEDTKPSDSQSALALLGLLQEKGRLLDFAMDDITPYSDQEVGQVARVVHQGLQEVLSEAAVITPVHDGSEGDVVSVGDDLNPYSYRCVGNLSKQPPLSGKVLHRGWKAQKFSIPYAIANSQVNNDIVHPMEIEVS